MTYHQIKFGCKKINSSADIVETVISDQMSPHCDPELEESKPIFLYDTLAHDFASSYQVWLQKVQQLRRHCLDEHLLEFWTLSVTLTWTTTEQSNLFTRQSTLWWCTIKPSLVAKGSAVQTTYQSYFDHITFCSYLDLENSKSIFLHELVSWCFEPSQPIFLHDTPTHNHVSQSQVWKQNVW